MIEHSTNPLAYPLFFLLGSIIYVLGIGFVLLYVTTRTKGYGTTGTIIGAIKRTRIKQKKDREPELKTYHYLVLEYESKDGKIKKGTTSEWSNTYKSFAEGQVVKLLVVSSQAFDDLYLRDDHSAFKIGGVMAIVGLFMLFMVSQSVWFWLMMIVLTLLFIIGFYIFFSRVDTSKAPLPDHKIFTEDEIFAIDKIGQ